MANKVEMNKLPILTPHLFSFKYKDENKFRELAFADKCKIVAAFVFGFLLGGIGSPIAGLATSYYLRNRTIEVLEKEEIEQDIAATKAKTQQEFEKTFRMDVQDYVDPLDGFEPETPWC
jgi:hypothetical protein